MPEENGPARDDAERAPERRRGCLRAVGLAIVDRPLAFGLFVSVIYLIATAALGVAVLFLLLSGQEQGSEVHGMILVVPLMVMGYAALFLPFFLLLAFWVRNFRADGSD